MESKEVTPIYQRSDFQEKLSSLTKQQLKYFNVMRTQYGVPYIKSKPGIGKSAIAKTIADKMGLQYIDIRLSMADETDLQFPNITYREDIKRKVIEFAIPEWAAKANQKPTLIHFEELNRAPLAIRNAALQILLDRCIGADFSFNENVFMVASGNLGEDDGTDVDDFDNALNNRLIHINHELSVEDWLEWGEGRIHPDILSFINLYPSNFYVKPNEDTETYASPRSWQMLSEFVYKNFGGGPKLNDKGEIILDSEKNPVHFLDGYKIDKKGNVIKSSETNEPLRNWGDYNDYIYQLEELCFGFVGYKAAAAFIKFLQERTTLSLKDIINDYDKVKEKLEEFNRDKKSELISEAKESRIDKWSEKNIENFTSFLKECSSDERMGFLLHIIDTSHHKYENGVKTPSVKKLLTNFKEDFKKIEYMNDKYN